MTFVRGLTRPRRFTQGVDPDPRFTLANERTFLAWIRTALGLIAAAVGFEAFGPDVSAPVRAIVVVGLLVAAVVTAIGCFVRWGAVEAAMRTGRSLPVPALAPLMSGILVGAAGTLIIALGFR
ncbi:YidH family protein [Tsukamurella sp. PLM1]|uniref:YidH family protein n=1 Tax=Tsukamurella sp. PLM1 TaxID=2929795 RepID=UPI00206F243E|nr:DUF202 domain-containing protein [Tsukamurella sp. PLM1]BDH58777.1 membrane protein [Tsukamurella sp. PLM1]